MMIAELHITREGVERARSQAMVNTPSAVRAHAQRNLSDAVFIATALILMACENQAGRMLDFEQFRRFIVSTLQQRAEFQITEALDGL
jgi:hypothetical protein